MVSLPSPRRETFPRRWAGRPRPGGAVSPGGRRSTELAGPGLMSLTMTVPCAVPSLFHSSKPCTPSSAVKNSVPLTSVRFPIHAAGNPPAGPGLMSLTILVPAAVPSLFHSSRPCTPSSAVKNSVPLRLVRNDGDKGPELSPLTGTVPAAVPSLFHSPTPWRSSHAKNSVPLTSAQARLKPAEKIGRAHV